MTPEERKILDGFLDRLRQPQDAPQDAEAAALIRQALDRDPDLAYRLTQTALVYEQGLAQAQAQIRDLRAEREGSADAPPARGDSRFLGTVPRVPPPSPDAGRAIAARDAGFLGSAMRTALGVAGGMALFSGLHGLFDGGDAQAADVQEGGHFDEGDESDYDGGDYDGGDYDGGDYDGGSFDF